MARPWLADPHAFREFSDITPSLEGQPVATIEARLNGKRGRAWPLIVAYEPDDTYTVWLVEGCQGRKAGSMVLACHRDVYCDVLQSVIESTYDEAIREHNGGFIPLS